MFANYSGRPSHLDKPLMKWYLLQHLTLTPFVNLVLFIMLLAHFFHYTVFFSLLSVYVLIMHIDIYTFL